MEVHNVRYTCVARRISYHDAYKCDTHTHRSFKVEPIRGIHRGILINLAEKDPMKSICEERSA